MLLRSSFLPNPSPAAAPQQAPSNPRDFRDPHPLPRMSAPLRRALRSCSSTRALPRNARSLGSVAESLAKRAVASGINQYIDDSIPTDFPASLVDVDAPIRPLVAVEDFLDGHAVLRERERRREDGLRVNGASSSSSVGGDAAVCADDEWGSASRPVAEVDPFALSAGYIDELDYGMKRLLGSDNPLLDSMARYLFEGDTGKKVRPTMVVLLAQATAADRDAGGEGAEGAEGAAGTGGAGVGQVLSPAALAAGLARRGSQEILPSQLRLAEITEMIHTASLLHDDVIDKAEMRRGRPSVNHAFGNKLSILGGDFLLARASVAMARLRDVEVVELLATTIEHLVKGELMQVRGGGGKGRRGRGNEGLGGEALM